MPRPVTLFTGQWADMPLKELAPLAKQMGYDGLELACWGDHFNVQRILQDDDYMAEKWAILEENDLSCYSLSTHLVSQAICDHVDKRHQAVLPNHVWGNGDAEGVRQRAAQEMMDTAKAAAKFGVKQINGFTGSSIWHAIYAFPPTSQDYWDEGFKDFANRWKPIMDVFEDQDINYGFEVHPTEIAFDIATAERALEALNYHPRFGFNYDPSHLAYQFVDYIKFIHDFSDSIFHVHMKDVWWGRGNGDIGVFGGHSNFADKRRFWDFRSVGRGDIDFEAVIVALNEIDYIGPLSVEWEDSRMDRVFGATESASFVKQLDFEPFSKTLE